MRLRFIVCFCKCVEVMAACCISRFRTRICFLVVVLRKGVAVICNGGVRICALLVQHFCLSESLGVDSCSVLDRYVSSLS